MYKFDYNKLKRDLDAFARSNGISQKECYSKVNISDNGLRNAVKRDNLGIKYLLNIADYINTHPAVYFYEEGDTSHNNTVEESREYYMSDGKINRLLHLLENCENRRNSLEKENEELRKKVRK